MREILDIIKHKQRSQVEHHKDELIESHTRAQITRLIGNSLNCSSLAATYTTWELEQTMMARFFDAGKSHSVLLHHYGVPERTLRQWVKKVLDKLGCKTLREVQCKIRDRGVRREDVKNEIRTVIENKKCGRPTQLTRDEEALMVAKAELEGVHGFPVAHKELGHRLNDLIMELGVRKTDIGDKSKLQLAKRVISRINCLEPISGEQVKWSRTGEIKVSGLSHKRAKQSDPRLAWLMFRKICEMCRDVRTRERKQREELTKPIGLDLLSSVVDQLNDATPPVPPQVPAPDVPPQVPAPFLRKKYKISNEEAKKSLEELTIVPDDITHLQPRPSQCWNCDEIGIDPTGKWCKIVCTWKYCMSEKIWKCKDGEHAPFWVTVLFFTRADGQCFLPPVVVHKGAEQTADFHYGVPADWLIHHSPSGYMDRDGWYKVVRMFTKLSGASKGNIQILFYDGHDSHWDADALDIMATSFVQPFVLKAGNSENDQPNDNGSNAKLKSCYNERKSKWTRKFLSHPFSPAHMNTVIVAAWSDFLLDSAGIIRRSFFKTKLCPLQPPSADNKYLGNACVASLQCGTGKKSKELEIMIHDKFAPAKFSSKRTCDEIIIMRSQRNFSRNILIRSAAYDALYKTVVIPAQELKDIQQEIDSQRKIRITKQMNPLKTRMNPDSSSGIYVAGEARAHARLVEINRSNAAREKLNKRAATEKRNSTSRENREEAFQRVRKTVTDNESDSLATALDKHKPATDIKLALQHLGTKPSTLADGKKATVINAIVQLHPDSFSSNPIPTIFEPTETYDEIEDLDSDIEVQEI